MAIRISRNTQAPAEFAGRAASPTMRFSGATLNAEKQAIAAEGEVTKLAFNAGTSIASGLAAGFSGQTTEDLGAIAAQGKDATDAAGFNMDKFTQETISSLGGVGGLMEGVEKQNVAINMVDNYQKGVAIGEAHVKQQSEMVVMTASTTAEANFREDMAKGKYDGAVNRSWQSHQDALTKAMNDPNTTPAVRSKIQAYMSSDIAKAKFDNQYVAKEANAIAQRTAKNANAIMSVAVKNGNMDKVNELVLTQGKEVFRTPEQVEALQHQATYNNLELNAVDTNKTPNELTEYSSEIQKRKDLSKEEKSNLVKKINTQRGVNRTDFIERISTQIHDPQVDALFQDGVDNGYLTPADVNRIKKKFFSETAKPIKNLPNLMSSEISEINKLPTEMEKIEALAILEENLLLRGTVGQDAVTKKMVSDYKKQLNKQTGIASANATSLFSDTADDTQKVLDSINVEEESGAWYKVDRNLDKTEPASIIRHQNAKNALSSIEEHTADLYDKGKSVEAATFYAEAYPKWKLDYSGNVFVKDVLNPARASEDLAKKNIGTFEEVANVEAVEAQLESNRQENVKSLSDSISKLQGEKKAEVIAETKRQKEDVFTTHTLKAVGKQWQKSNAESEQRRREFRRNQKPLATSVAFDKAAEVAIPKTIEILDDLRKSVGLTEGGFDKMMSDLSSVGLSQEGFSTMVEDVVMGFDSITSFIEKVSIIPALKESKANITKKVMEAKKEYEESK